MYLYCPSDTVKSTVPLDPYVLCVWGRGREGGREGGRESEREREREGEREKHTHTRAL